MAKPYSVEIHPSAAGTARAAATKAAEILRAALQSRGRARLLVATGNSQLQMMGFLTQEPDIDWGNVEAFHLDEYVGIGADHPASFRRWIRQNFEEKVRPRAMRYIQGDAPDLQAKVKAYATELRSGVVDLAFVGIGENGHIAFNDPPVADFNDPLAVKVVTLDEACRRQQVGEGHFPDLDHVPREACSVTCSELMRASHWVCCVPDRRKARAVKASLEGPVTTACPGSLVQRHVSAAVFLDADSAALLDPEYVRRHCSVRSPHADAGFSR